MNFMPFFIQNDAKFDGLDGVLSGCDSNLEVLFGLLGSKCSAASFFVLFHGSYHAASPREM